MTDVPLSTDLEECTIPLTDTRPVNVKQYPLPNSQVGIVRKEVETC